VCKSKFYCGVFAVLTYHASQVVAAADALVELHSYRVAHLDLSDCNVMILPDPNECFPIRFIDFGCALVIPVSRLKTSKANYSIGTDRVQLLYTLVKTWSYRKKEARPLLRAIPARDSVQLLIDKWGILPTLEEEKARSIAQLMEWGISEEEARKKTDGFVF
jgi:serine/threonine protein kinase